MSYCIQFSGGSDAGKGKPEGTEPTTLFLCSIGSWGRFIDWALATSPDINPRLHELCQEGTTKDTLSLAVELELLRDESPPDDPDVLDTLAELLEAIGTGDPEETATIVD